MGSRFFPSTIWGPGIKLRLDCRHLYLPSYLADSQVPFLDRVKTGY